MVEKAKKVIEEERVLQALRNAVKEAQEAQPNAKVVDLLKKSVTGPRAIYFNHYHKLWLQDPTKTKGSYEDIARMVKKLRKEMIAEAEEHAEQIPASVNPAPLWLEEKWTCCVETLHHALEGFRASIAAVDMQRCISVRHEADAKVAIGLASANERIAEAVEEASESMEVAFIFERQAALIETELKAALNDREFARKEAQEERNRANQAVAAEAEARRQAAVMETELKAALHDRELARKEAHEERNRANQAVAAEAEARRQASIMETELKAALDDRNLARKEAQEERNRANQAVAAEAEARRQAAVLETELKATRDDRDLARKEAHGERERANQALADKASAIAATASLAEQHKAEIAILMNRITVSEMEPELAAVCDQTYLPDP